MAIFSLKVAKTPWSSHISQQGRNQLFIWGGGNFHEISFDDVIVLIQSWYNYLFCKRSHILTMYFCPQTRSP